MPKIAETWGVSPNTRKEGLCEFFVFTFLAQPSLPYSFFSDACTAQTGRPIFMSGGLNDVVWRKDVPYDWGRNSKV